MSNRCAYECFMHMHEYMIHDTYNKRYIYIYMLAMVNDIDTGFEYTDCIQIYMYMSMYEIYII